MELTQEQIAAAEAAGATEFELSQILSLKRLAAQFAEAFYNLLRWGDAVEGTDLEAEYAALVERGYGVRDKAAAVMNSIDSMVSTVVGWFRKLASWLPGLDGLGTMRPLYAPTLGAVWFIPLAGIGVAIGALTFWLSDYAKFAKRFAEAQRIAADLRAEGVPPIEAERQAAAAVAGTAPGMFAGFGSGLSLVLLLGGGYVVYRLAQQR
jgi:hypothetical protein